MTRSVSTWHHVGPERSNQKEQCSSRAARHSRSFRRRARAPARDPPLVSSQQRSRNARQRRSAERSAMHHAGLAARAAATLEGSSSAPATTRAVVVARAISKRERDDDESVLTQVPSAPGGGVLEEGTLPEPKRQGLRVGFLLGVLLPLGFIFVLSPCARAGSGQTACNTYATGSAIPP